MTMAARAATVVLGAAAIVLATACTRVVDDARVVAAPDMGKAGAIRLGLHVGRRADDLDPRSRPTKSR